MIDASVKSEGPPRRPVTGWGRTSPRRSARLTDEQREESLKYLGLCEIRADQFAGKCRKIDREDFYQAAYEGLADAIKGYEDGHDAEFATYAHRRMIGACQDMLRNEGTVRVKRAGRRDGVSFHYVSIDVPAQFLGTATTIGELVLPPSGEPAPDAEAESVDTFDALLRGLNPDERFLMEKYYGRDAWTMKRIGAHLGQSECRVSQMHKVIIAHLRDKMSVPRYRERATA